MTLDEWFDKYFAPEYLNVQHPGDWKASAQDELQIALGKAQPPQPIQKV